MNLFGLNISISRASAPTPATRSAPSSAAAVWLRGDDPAPVSRYLANAYEQVIWVYRAVNAVAEQIANIPFLFSRGERGRENLITSGPLLDFYNRPHPQLNHFQYWELRVLWLLLRGECFRVPVYSTLPGTDRKSELKKIIFLDPESLQPIIQDHQLRGWRYNARGHTAPLDSQIFLPEEIWFEKLPNPFNPWRGLAPLYVAESAARADFTASSFMRGLLENNADAGLIVHTTEHLTEEQRVQISAALRNRKRSAGTADTPLLLWDGLQVTQPTLSSADLQFLENRKFSRSEICAAFGVPEEIVATTDHNKYDVMQGARLNFIENRIAPLCARLEAEENATTIPALTQSPTEIQNPKSKIENIVGWFDLDSLPIMQQARRSRLAAAKTGFDMGIPFNELNRVLDLGFKSLPWGDTGFLPGRLLRVGELPPEPKKPLTLNARPEGPQPSTAADPATRLLELLPKLSTLNSELSTAADPAPVAPPSPPESKRPPSRQLTAAELENDLRDILKHI